jgi:cytochrome c oxidase assembly protein subunit 15
MGGLVTSHGAGMSVPDWPNSYGYNMFLFPPRLWIGGILYEHTHRLLGTVVGMLSIGLTVHAWHTQIANAATAVARFVTRGRVRATHIPSAFTRSMRWLCLSVLAAVIFQGVLGGLRVVLVKLDLAIVHACVAQAFFCLAALVAVATSRWWIDAPDFSRSEDAAAGKQLTVACVFATVIIYGQLIVGATMRHYQAGLAVPDFPLAYGQVIPSTDAASLAQINDHRAWEMNLPRVTASQIWLHMGHRMGAVLVTIAILTASTLVLRRHGGNVALLRPALLLIVLLITQITLGALTVVWRKPADVASLHVAVGALTLVTTFVLLVRSMRLYYAKGQPDHAMEAIFCDSEGLVVA